MALEAAVRRGRGSARDALSALDQVVASGSADAARPELAQVLDALADGDVSAVLVALSALLAGGWGPQQLATELIDDLRQVFLAPLAPELTAASGSSLERFAGLAETMGLARVVRSMELLGHALVDMREAPDAQVVLEIAVVRAVRPDLDSGMEALSERVSVLERSLSGAAAYPRPGTQPTPAAPPAGSTPTGGCPRSRSDARDAGRPPRRRGEPASVHRRGAPQPESGRRGIGGRARHDGTATRGTRTGTEPRQPVATAAERGDRRAVDRDSLTEAWGDGILRALPARAKALYSAGSLRQRRQRRVRTSRSPTRPPGPVRRTGPDGGGGARRALRLPGDPGARRGRRRSAGRRDGSTRWRPGVPPTRDPTDVEEVDPAEFANDVSADPTDHASAAEARLLEAFPGASEVAG